VGFFQDIKDRLEETLTDLKTIEHALVVEDEKMKCIYRFEQLDGDSICFISEDQVDLDYYPVFNEAFKAASVSRSGLSRFIIECIT
jgi:hypothetical protein